MSEDLTTTGNTENTIEEIKFRMIVVPVKMNRETTTYRGAFLENIKLSNRFALFSYARAPNIPKKILSNKPKRRANNIGNLNDSLGFELAVTIGI